MTEKNMEKVLNQLRRQSFYEDQILHIQKFEKRPPVLRELQSEIDPQIEKWLDSNAFSLYSHQVQAVDGILSGNNIIVVTSTASGKSLGYNIPVLHSLLNEEHSTFLYLFPQKALARDQYEKILEAFEFCGIEKELVGVYDGDTPKDEKARIRKNARLIITNPYGLHWYLPHKHLWTRVWRNLKYIVIDECHHYRGIFGSNFAQVVRRLKRILRNYRKKPQFILSSATIRNPMELAQKLTGEQQFLVISKDGSPDPGRYFVLWDLPMYGDSDQYKSAHTQTRYLFNYVVERGLQTLSFTLSRKMAELNAYFSKRYFSENDNIPLAESIISYRAGLNPRDRRRIEKGLRDGDLLGVYATSALELGVDIGSLECTLLSGFPGTIASMWQQIGRAGRQYDPKKGIEALSFLVPMANPLDLYYVRHHEELFEKQPEFCNINLENEYILKGHVKCASKESPLSSKDDDVFGQKYKNVIEDLEDEGTIKKRGKRYYYNGRERFIPKSVNLSGIPDNDYKVIIETIDGDVIVTHEEKGYVFKEMHEGAIYLYMAQPYRVRELNFETKTVYLEPDDGATYTDARVIEDIQQIGKPQKSRVEHGINIYYGDVNVTESVIGFDIIDVETQEKIMYEQLEMPEINFDTKAVWFSIDPKFINEIEAEKLDFDGSIHAIEHAAISMAPFFCMCDRWDIGGVSTRQGDDSISNWPVIYIYDGFPGGIGISESLYDLLISLLEKTLDLISTCKCKEKCPGCVISPKCGNNNDPLDKQGAIKLLKMLLEENL